MSVATLRRSFTQLPGLVRKSHTDSHVVYQNPRRLRAAGMTALAIGQAGFWASATALAQQVPDPLFSPAWSVAGFGLSAAFAGMIGAYLRRNVAEISLISGPALQVTAHSFGGLMRRPVTISADDIVPGPRQDDQSERYWTFGVRGASSRSFFYIVDMKSGVVDREALGAIARGGDHLLVFAHKRDGGLMQNRWQEWERSKPRSKTPAARTGSAKVA